MSLRQAIPKQHLVLAHLLTIIQTVGKAGIPPALDPVLGDDSSHLTASISSSVSTSISQSFKLTKG